MERDVPFRLDELGQSRGAPQFGGEAVRGRALGQPALHDLLLRGREFAGPAGHGAGEEALAPLIAEGGTPTADAAGIHPEDVGDVLDGVALRQPLHGEETPMLKFGW